MNSRTAKKIKQFNNRLQQLNISAELMAIASLCIEEMKDEPYMFLENRAILIGIIKGYNPDEPDLLRLFQTYRAQDEHFDYSRAALRYILGKGNGKYGTDIPVIPAVDLQLIFSSDPEGIKDYYIEVMVLSLPIWMQVKEVMDFIVNNNEERDII